MMRSTALIAVGVIATLTISLAAYAVAAGDAGTLPKYTGCLKNGKLESVAVGDVPLAPCGPGQPEVRLSGGDVTSVGAGPGLTGGGEAGAVKLAVDPSTVQSRVSGSCERDRLGPIDASISAIHADGSVSCNPDDAGPGSDVFAGFYDGPVGVPVNDTHAPVSIARLAVPRGKYLVSGTLDLASASFGGNYASCELRAGADFDRTTLGLGGVFGQIGTRDRRLALQVTHEFAEPGDLVIACAATDTAHWSFLKIAATRVSSLTNAPLELVSR
jgi:hypothetical protein